MTITEDQVRNALNTIVEFKEDKALNYAVNYAWTGKRMEGEALRIQCLYVLNNITHWRRKPEAKEVRDILKEFVKKGKN